jgi:hypothetical protein
MEHNLIGHKKISMNFNPMEITDYLEDFFDVFEDYLNILIDVLIFVAILNFFFG